MSFQHRFVQGLGVRKRMHPSPWLGRVLLAITLLVLGTQAASADAVCTQSNGQWKCSCSGKWDANVQGFDYSSLDESPAKPWLSPQTAPDLEVSGLCSVPPLHQTYYFRNVNIIRTTQQSASGPSRSILLFKEEAASRCGSRTHFWARAIIIENGGELYAYGFELLSLWGPPQNLTWQPFGYNLGVLTIHLYGKMMPCGIGTHSNSPNRTRACCARPRGGGRGPPPTSYTTAVRHSQGNLGESGNRSDAAKAALPCLGRTRATNPGLRLFTSTDHCMATASRVPAPRTGVTKVFKDGKCRNSKGEESPNAEVGYFGNKVLACFLREQF